MGAVMTSPVEPDARRDRATTLAIRKAFARVDAARAELRAAEANLKRLRTQYMVDHRVWGISEEALRREIG